MTTTSQDRYGDDFGGEAMWGLKELPWPDAIAYTPQTVGWLLVALLAGALLAWWIRRRRRAWRRDAWRRTAIAELEAIAADPARLRELPALLRRSALHLAPREDVASLRGGAWIAWLNASAGRELFAAGDAARLDRLVYSRDAPTTVLDDRQQRLLDGGRQWLRQPNDRV